MQLLVGRVIAQSDNGATQLLPWPADQGDQRPGRRRVGIQAVGAHPVAGHDERQGCRRQLVEQIEIRFGVEHPEQFDVRLLPLLGQPLLQ